MKIFLGEVIDEGRSAKVEVLYPPIGLGYLASYILKKRPGWNVRISRGGDSMVSEIEHFAPDVVGLGFVTQNSMIGLDVVRGVRGVTEAPVVLGGHHVSALPYWAFDEVGFDDLLVVHGEGERTFWYICEAVSLKMAGIGSWSQIANIYYGDGDEVCYSGSSLRGDLADDLPMPVRDAFIYDDSEAHIFTSRGCPFTCTFCSSACFWGKPQYHSPMRVASEIEYLYTEYGVFRFNIYDDLFAVNKKRVGFIMNCIAKRKKLKEVPLQFSCLGRASVMDKELAGMLKQMGVVSIAFGLESGSDRVLKSIKGKSASVESNLEAVDICKDAGLVTVGSVIYGMPGETFEDALETVEMVQDMELGGGEAYLATPYPGTPLWDDALKRGVVSESMDFSRLRFWSEADELDDRAVVISDKMGLGELNEIKKRLDAAFPG
ncbi:MAG: B12-binding domain-containing radical SAM protein [Gammaproteobacteria bacterium]|nr:B12-binding domain-containing radical SAM protein [Gammaproteobacteria bacterium]